MDQTNPGFSHAEIFPTLRITEKFYRQYVPRIVFYQQQHPIMPPSPELQIIHLIQYLQFETSISTAHRSLAMGIFETYGKPLLIKGIKPVLIALAIFQLVEKHSHDVKLHLHRMSKQLHVSVFRLYAVFHLLEERIPRGLDLADLKVLCPSSVLVEIFPAD